MEWEKGIAVSRGSALVGLFCACGAFAQVRGDNIINTFAGDARTSPDCVAGKNAPIGPVNGAHLDTAGNVIFADPGAPIKAGDALTIYCTGLGALDAATAASATPPNVKHPVTVTVGDAKATVSSTGDAIPLTVSTLGQSSVPVNIAVR